MMRLMNLRTEGRRLAVSPAHVRYIEREEHSVKVYITDEAIPLRVSGAFDQVVKEWEDALQGRAWTANTLDTDPEPVERDEPTPAYGSPRYRAGAEFEHEDDDE